MSETETGPVSFTREQLYEAVWTKPMRHLAPSYGLSDVGLAKICRKLQIPTPPVGYWQKLEFGHRVEQPPLPELEGDQPTSISLTKTTAEPDRPLSEVEVLIQVERQSEHQIVVPTTLDSLHPLVEKTDRSLRAAKADAKGLVTPRAKGCLAVTVGPQSIDRASLILDALAKALESRGFPVTAADEKSGLTHVEILTETIGFRLEEALDKKERELSAAEKRRREQYAWLSSRRPEYDYFPSGKLALVIGESSGGTGSRRRWGDGKTQSLETLLNRFVAGLIQAADDKKAARLRHEEWERKRQEERQQRHKAEVQRREAEARAKEFEANVAAWYRAHELNQYVEAVRAEAIRRHGSVDEHSEVGQWLAWAERCVASMNPLHESKPLPCYSVDEQTKERWLKELSMRSW